MDAKLILFCGPSGSGKTTIVKHLLSTFPVLSFSVSATTRSKRNNETDGKDYYFISVDEFTEKISEGAFLEWEEVYENGFYGTLASEVSRINKEGKVAIFDVDVEGGLHIKERFGKNLLDVMVVPPSITALRERLIARESETQETLEKRIGKAGIEMGYRNRFTNVIVNTKLQEALAEAEKIVSEFLNNKEG